MGTVDFGEAHIKSSVAGESAKVSAAKVSAAGFDTYWYSAKRREMSTWRSGDSTGRHNDIRLRRR